jgi:hypothetical protein
LGKKQIKKIKTETKKGAWVEKDAAAKLELALHKRRLAVELT